VELNRIKVITEREQFQHNKYNITETIWGRGCKNFVKYNEMYITHLRGNGSGRNKNVTDTKQFQYNWDGFTQNK
jgi:hypothetical protein